MFVSITDKIAEYLKIRGEQCYIFVIVELLTSYSRFVISWLVIFLFYFSIG